MSRVILSAPFLPSSLAATAFPFRIRGTLLSCGPGLVLEGSLSKFGRLEHDVKLASPVPLSYHNQSSSNPLGPFPLTGWSNAVLYICPAPPCRSPNLPQSPAPRQVTKHKMSLRSNDPAFDMTVNARNTSWLDGYLRRRSIPCQLRSTIDGCHTAVVLRDTVGGGLVLVSTNAARNPQVHSGDPGSRERLWIRPAVIATTSGRNLSGQAEVAGLTKRQGAWELEEFQDPPEAGFITACFRPWIPTSERAVDPGFEYRRYEAVNLRELAEEDRTSLLKAWEESVQLLSAWVHNYNDQGEVSTVPTTPARSEERSHATQRTTPLSARALEWLSGRRMNYTV